MSFDWPRQAIATAFRPRVAPRVTLPRATSSVMAVFAAALLVVAGCSGTVRNKVLSYTPDPVAEARAVVQAYANGQPIGSEMGTYDELVGRVAAADAAKGAKLQQYFAEIKKKGSADVAKAKKMLADF